MRRPSCNQKNTHCYKSLPITLKIALFAVLVGLLLSASLTTATKNLTTKSPKKHPKGTKKIPRKQQESPRWPQSPKKTQKSKRSKNKNNQTKKPKLIIINQENGCKVYKVNQQYQTCLEFKLKKCLKWLTTVYMKKCISTKKDYLHTKKWRPAISAGIKDSLGVLYKKPRCPKDYVLKPYRLGGYIKLRCRKAVYNALNGTMRFDWKDSETSRNGRRLIFMIQGKPYCGPGFELREVLGHDYMDLRCERSTGGGEGAQNDRKSGEKGKIQKSKKPRFRSLDEKKKKALGWNVQYKSLPHCKNGWILRDFDMGNWIKIRCFKRVRTLRETCTQFKQVKRVKVITPEDIKDGKIAKIGGLFSKRFLAYHCINRYSGRFKRVRCLQRAMIAPKKSKRKPKCSKKIYLKRAQICLESRVFNSRNICIKWIKTFPKLRCIKNQKIGQKMTCLEYVVLRPTVYCKRLIYHKLSAKLVYKSQKIFDSTCLEFGIFFGRDGIERIGCTSWDSLDRCLTYQLLSAGLKRNRIVGRQKLIKDL